MTTSRCVLPLFVFNILNVNDIQVLIVRFSAVFWLIDIVGIISLFLKFAAEIIFAYCSDADLSLVFSGYSGDFSFIRNIVWQNLVKAIDNVLNITLLLAMLP